MKKIVRAAAITSAAILTTALGVTPAQALKQYDGYHTDRSQRRYLLVFETYSCRGSMDHVPRDSEAEIDFGSIWVPKDHSLWVGKYRSIEVRHSRATSKGRCVSLRSWPDGLWHDTYWTLYRGQRRGRG